MARLDDLVAQVADQSLRQEMEAALAEMKRRQRFGARFEVDQEGALTLRLELDLRGVANRSHLHGNEH